VATAKEEGNGARLHIGVTPWREDWTGPAEALVSQARLAEDLGFRSFWLPESHFTGRSAIPAPLLRLAAVAAHTKTLQLATTSYLLPVRHPLHAAAEVAELDRLSGGRVILGVGRGFRPALFRAFGVPVREKRDRFEATLEAMQAAWRGEPVTPNEPGAAEDEPPVVLAPLPVQQPHPPIWVAGFGPKAVAQAGRLGLPYLASPIETLEALLENYGRHREAHAEAGHAHDLAVPVMRTVFVSRNPALVARVRVALGRQASALASLKIASMRRHASAAVDDWALIGGPDEVLEGIGRYREKLGVSHLIVRSHVPGAEPEEVSLSLELLAGLAEGDVG
jgi:alkanesulfonate monooxygenase SsuD/methylene tetrahydromethanopterin reductase-like flavin-dependent oxidoreductase (luciferase family)